MAARPRDRAGGPDGDVVGPLLATASGGRLDQAYDGHRDPRTTRRQSAPATPSTRDAAYTLTAYLA